MHILFLTDNFPPEVNAPSSRTFEHCREWVAAGHRVTVITCVPNFPAGKVLAGYRNRLWQTETMAGINVVRVWSYLAPNAGFTRRILDFLSYALTSAVAALFIRRVDVVVGTSPQLFTACAACFAGFAKRLPYVFELRDLWPESIKHVGAMRDSIAIRMLERLELFLYRRAALIIAVTHSFVDSLVVRGIDPRKIRVVTNGVDLTRYQPRPRDEALAAFHQLTDLFVAGYIGTHGMAHGLTTLLDTAEKLQHAAEGRDIRILLIGDGSEKDALIRQAQARALDNVVFVDSVGKDDIVRYWSLLDATIVHLRRAELFKSVIPSKMFEAMSMGVPILMGVEGEAGDIVQETGSGLLFEPDDADGLFNLLIALKADPQLRERLSRQGQMGARQYDRRGLASEMLAHLAEIAAVPRP